MEMKSKDNYQLYDPQLRKIFNSRNVKFNETKQEFKQEWMTRQNTELNWTSKARMTMKPMSQIPMLTHRLL